MRLRSLALLVVLAPLTAFAEPTADKTLSPYFFIEDGDPATDRLPLEKTSVKLTVAGVIADVSVQQTYKNQGKKPINARYVFPASTRAAVHGLRMVIGNEVIEAKIKRREEARADFEAAKREGKNATLLEQDRPNVFTMNVANIMPGDTIMVELRYTELLVPTAGRYEVVYPTVVGPRYANGSEADAAHVATPYQHAGEAPKIQFELSATIAAGLPIEEMSSPSHTVHAFRTPDRGTANVVLDGKDGGNRDFILRWRLAGGAIKTGLLLFPPAGNGDGFFLFMAQPPARITPAQIPPREFVFVVDVSGSMHGFPIDTAKHLLRDLAAQLRPEDRFNVILFSGGSRVLSPFSLPATPENLALAERVLGQENGGGGTELLPALRTAMALPRTGTIARSFVIVTDGYIAAEAEAFKTIRQGLGDASVYAFGIGSGVNRHLIEGLARAGLGEPFVVTEPAQSLEAARRFKSYIEAPVLTGIRLHADGFQIHDVEPAAIPDLLADRPVVVFGKYRGAPAGTLRLTGTSGAGKFVQAVQVASVAPADVNRALPYLWARARIADLSDLQIAGEDKAVEEKVVELGLAYNLLTRYTSFIAVRHVVRNPAGGAENVNQPQPMPAGVSDLAVPMAEGAEPGLLLMLFALALAAAFYLPLGRVRR